MTKKPKQMRMQKHTSVREAKSEMGRLMHSKTAKPAAKKSKKAKAY